MRDLLARCQERGIDPLDLQALGARTGRQPWQALAPFYADYLDNLDWQGAVDYSGLVRRTAQLLANPEVLGEVAGDLRLIVVDEYQDTDPAQEQVLRALAATRAQLVVVGDPDQSIYGFRGADVSGILNFAGPVPRVRGRQRAQVLALGRCRRSGPELVAASRARRGSASPARAARGGGRPSPSGAGARPRARRASRRVGAAFRSPAQEAAAVADALRRAHLIDGLAVVVHGGAGAQHPARRAVAAGPGRRRGPGGDPGRRAATHP